MNFIRVFFREIQRYSVLLLFVIFSILSFLLVFISLPLIENITYKYIIKKDLEKEDQISANIIKKLTNYQEDISLIEKISTNKTFFKIASDMLEVLLTENTSYVYAIYFNNGKSFILIDVSKKDRMKTNDLFEFLQEETPVIKKALESGQYQYLIHTSVKTIGLTFYKPFKDKKNIDYLLVIDYSIEKISYISQLISVLKTFILLFIFAGLVIINVIIFLALKASYYKQRSFTDNLTGLYNRNYLQHIMDFKYIIALIDIDYFKKINDTYGHAIGDKVLKSVANTMKKLTREEDIFIRYGGEEFLLLAKVDRKQDIQVMLNLFERIRSNIEKLKIPITDGDYIKTTISIGVYLNTNKDKNINEAIKKADVALYKAKSKGRNRIEIYDEEKEAEKKLITVVEVKDAIEENRLLCYYQPIVDLKVNNISHYEALVRIIDKNGNVVPPFNFLNVIENTFIYTKLTKAVIDYNYNILKKHKNLKVSINLKQADVLNRSIVDYLLSISKEKDITERMLIEIVETEDLLAYEESLEIIKQLKEAGYSICLDDFGSGYSNFVYLLRLNVDYLKIDANLIKNIVNDDVSYEVVRMIAQFCKKMKIKTIAEYVENEEILGIIKELDIDYGQGYLFSKPKPIEEIIDNE
ncbi:MAG TPA: bifunctional diguanylate cyclase/phosphodiesterase [Sulfurihydrogenibium sp.]|uniref:EAL domain-containing protein n=1 Tax=Sulfurihydrogenibium sp. (strain YO3AOP1) TaxID=436114 RepID=UPI0001750CAB|nr:bifunctional diguanylate cyclase/phosphodiesterase [Sulfurihydrogenibium sp. YO3AOP1]ACD67200.1 diguanylate cyclase/phosphodiesterase [Sulfurihydrogenibium sp. YO3AOP1]HBT99220.1 bifunctional diguanylate cyclase/phosphodiesterase [Sulfurihydrogenibium sp.]